MCIKLCHLEAAIGDDHVKVDVIVTSGAAVVAAKQATSVIPIIFGVANDPLGTGLVASLATQAVPRRGPQ